MPEIIPVTSDLGGKADIMARFGRHVSSGKARFFQSAGIDFVMGRREGPYIWDVNGEVRLIDCHCNGGVYNLGHRNPEIIRALVASLDELDIGNHHLISARRAALAEQLASLTPGHLAYTVFAVAGGEAIDLAIKVARGYTARTKIVSAQGGYHGCTGLALAAGDAKFRGVFGPPLPGFAQVPFDDVDTLAAAVDEETAAVILETIPATNGMPIPDPAYFPAVRALCDRTGAQLIIDEVQAGLGRTGRLWGVEHFEIIPDILVIGKGLSGGIYPMAATCFRAPLEAVFHADPFIHISTFGGAEVGCAVAQKVLEISAAPAFLAHVSELADLFGAGFQELKTHHGDVLVGLRQKGLMMGIELTHAAYGSLFTKAAFDHGLLAIYAGNYPRVVQLLPPLTIERALVGEILERVDGALEQVRLLVDQSAARNLPAWSRRDV
jgi:acetylornithine/succinyldiaminopimelate/putrescine aminotransferase